MGILDTTQFVGDEADRYMDEAMGQARGHLTVGLSNWQEILGGGPFAMLPAKGMVSVGDVVRTVAAEAQEAREPMPPIIDVASFSEIDEMEDELVDVIVGASTPGDDILQPIASTPFPLTENLYRQFSASTPNGKMVRLDDEDSYGDFRAAGVQRSMNPSDVIDNGSGPHQYRPVKLSLPPYAEGCVDCWQEDDYICCSMRLPGADGQVKIATAATPVDAHVQEVTGYVERSGLPMVDVMGVLPHLVGMLGGGSLIPKLAAAAPSLLARPEARSGQVFVGRMKGGTNPSAAALIALLQMAQSGDPQALEEWGMLVAVANTPAGARLGEKMKSVQAHLVREQAA